MKVSDILTVAIRLEEEGERFYRELSEYFDGEIKKTFLELADQERVHAEIFRKMLDQENWDEVDSYLAGYAFYEVFPDTSEILRRKDLTLKEVLDIAISVEKDSIILTMNSKEVILMRVLLINPYSGGYYYRLGAVYPPLGLMYISSSLKRKGHSVALIDMNVEKFDLERFNFRDYDVVGISADTVRFPVVERIAEKAKAQNVTVVMGGPHTTACYHEILQKGLCDYVVLGEGERAFSDLVESIASSEKYPLIPGVAYMKDGEVIALPSRFLENLDDLPFPDREKVHLYRTKFAGERATSLITSRGCPFNCEFCSASQFMGRRIRWRSIENVIDELKILKKLGYGSVIFFDDNFTINPKRVVNLCEEMMRKDLRFKWWAFSRADELLGREDMVEAMSKAGCRMLFIGFESANDEVLEEYGKNLKSDIAFDVMNLLKKYKIDVFASFVIGALKDTRKTIEKTVKLAKKLKASIVQFSILTPYPGTVLFEKLKHLIFEKDWRKFDGTHLVFKHPNFSPKELRRLFIKAYYAVYTSPRLIFRRGIPFLVRLLSHREAYSL